MGRPRLPETAFNAAVKVLVRIYGREDLEKITQNMVLLTREANSTIVNLAPYFLEKVDVNHSGNAAGNAIDSAPPVLEDEGEAIPGIDTP